MTISIFHGSQFNVKEPVFGKGNPYNDYGLGFYATKNKGLAGEWAVLQSATDGYINEYLFDINDLNVLKLDTMPIENWIAVLMANRGGSYDNVIVNRMDKFIDVFGVDLSPFDVIEGWRADDAFFSYIEDFLSVGLSLEKMKEAMKFGDLGVQICLKSKKAFDKKYIKYINSYTAPASRFYLTASERDDNARKQYWHLKEKTKGTLIIDLIGRD
jgi:hypothetical protein